MTKTSFRSSHRLNRRRLAKQVLAAMQISDERVEDAFAAIRREDFLGPETWTVKAGRLHGCLQRRL